MYSIKKCENIDIEEFNFKLPHKINNKYISSVTLDDKISYIQLHNVKTLSGFYEEDGKYKIDIILNNEHYYNFFMNLEMLCINRVHQHYQKWFGIDSTTDVLDSSFISFLKLKGTDPILTIPIEQSNDDFECEVYNQQKKRISYNEIKNEQYISLIIRFNGIQFYRNKFATYWSISQIKIDETKYQQNIGTKLEKNIYHFIDSSDNDFSDDEDNSDDKDDEDDFEENEYIVKELINKYQTKNMLNKIHE